MSKEIFNKLSSINVNSKIEKKGKFNYLSWCFAWSELKKIDANAKTIVYHDENTNMPYFASKAGVIVKVGVVVNGLEHISYLPLMDFRNNAIKLEDFNMMDVNKAIQRCTVKAIALHGLGLYIYAGEDFPEEPEKPEKPEKPEPKEPELNTDRLNERLNACKNQNELKTVYLSFSKAEQKATLILKDQLKIKLSK